MQDNDESESRRPRESTIMLKIPVSNTRDGPGDVNEHGVKGSESRRLRESVIAVHINETDVRVEVDGVDVEWRARVDDGG